VSRSIWSRYRNALNPLGDLRSAFLRSDDRHATLDGARAITVLLMVLFHVLFGVVVLLKHNEPALDGFITSFPRYLGWMWQSQGSDPLFVMCGLLVGYTLYREYDRTGTLDIPRFYKRRLLRIMPLFVLALLLYMPTDSDNFKYLPSNLLFISNFFEGQRHIVPVGWSLDVQMHFYLIMPFMVLLLFRVRDPIALLVALFVASVAWRGYVVWRNPEIWQTPFYEILYDRAFGSLLANQLYYDIDVRIGCFFLGMLVALLHYRHGDAIQAFFRRHRLFTTLFVILGAVLVAGSISFPMENRYHPFNQELNATFSYWFLVADRYIYSVGLSMLVLAALCPAGLGRAVDWVLSWSIWHPFAQLIFPIYLFHFIFTVIAAVITFQTTDRDAITVVQTYQVFILFFWTVLLTTAFAAVTHIFIEKPFLNMRAPDGVQDHSALPNVVLVHEGQSQL
jgi:peptidoglycan/LPS O-acetylase OafA/YrhL